MKIRKIKMRFHNRWGGIEPHWHAEIYTWESSPHTFIPYGFFELTRVEDLGKAIDRTLKNIRLNPDFQWL